ncbi:hypothetical protein [Streptomyces sp. NRRL F-5727]|uniref:hypothetical protein n=1 Tax=Streptomyces sp. NRRL F-5727 TaxID=1463871 RepID=UPI0004C543ED|nr:hypothetical protein [Streptomyces sp. NRRL F-5727]
MSIPTQGFWSRTLGPETGLAQVLESGERQGHRDPAAAWQVFTRTWNWAAPLTTAVPGTTAASHTGTTAVPHTGAAAASRTATAAVSRTGLPRPPEARPVTGGFALSGQWRLPRHGTTGNWVALPLMDGPRERAQGTAGPDLFVVAAGSLAGLTTPDGGEDRSAPSGRLLRLAGAHVPAGFATYTTATPLSAEDAAFLWTAAGALALGAARRMTDELPGATGAGGLGEAGPSGALRAELAGMLHDERVSLAAVLHGAPAARTGLPEGLEERLAARAGRVAQVVHHVLAAAYQQVLAEEGGAGGHPLMSVIEAATPILQQARYATELLPPDDRTSRKEGRTR